MNLSLGKDAADGSGEDNGLRVFVTGKITQHDFDPVHEPLETLVGPGVYGRQITLDMSGATYMDSSGVGWLLTCYKRCRGAGGRIALCNVTPVIGNMLRLLKLTRHFGLSGPVEESIPGVGGLS
jgi:anti-sigma B factor antagonist/stage II sporulation protein AA (anti-sigma F factor antagonist)